MRKFNLIALIILTSLCLIACNQDSQNEIIFEDLTVEYNGEYQTIIPKNVPEGVEYTYEYEFNEKPLNEGSYVIRISMELDGKLTSYKANLTILKRVATIVVDDAYEIDGVIPTPHYTIYNLVEGESLNEELWFSDKKLMYSWDNSNYKLNVIRGGYYRSGDVINTYDELNYSVDPIYGDLYSMPVEIMPFTFKGVEKLQGKTVTSITFTFGGKEVYVDENSNRYYAEEFYLPIYKIKEDLSGNKEDCTIENGKKIVINITELVNNATRGDKITVSNLNIPVGEDEILVFGDSDMTFSIMCVKNNIDFQILRSIFNDPIYSAYSALIKIEGIH